METCSSLLIESTDSMIESTDSMIIQFSLNFSKLQDVEDHAGGIPNRLMMANNQVSRIDGNLLPSSEDAVRQYERTGGYLTHFREFGSNRFADTTHLVNQRDIEFNARYPTFDTIFS